MWMLFLLMLVVPSALLGAVDARFLSPQTKLIADFKIPQLLKSAAGPDARQWIVEAFYGCPMAETALENMVHIQFSAEQTATDSSPVTDWLILIDGTWDWPAVQACVKLAGYEDTDYRGIPMMFSPYGPNRASAVALFGGKTLLIGLQNIVRRAIDRAIDSTAPETELLARASVMDASWDYWITGDGSPLDFTKGTRKEVLEGMPKSRLYWLAISGTDAYTMELRLEMMTPEEAAFVLQFFEFIPNFVRLKPAESKLRSDVLSHVRVEAVGTSVKLTAVVPGAVLWTHLNQLTAGMADRSRFGRRRISGTLSTNTASGHR